VSLIAFSKGAVVLNQLLHEMPLVHTEQKVLHPLLVCIRAIYWLDGGHAGNKETWVTAPDLLAATVAALPNARFEVHVTPYQARCALTLRKL
jgi:hypothetical protein